MNEFAEATSFYQQTLAVKAFENKVRKGVLALSNYKIGLCYDMVNRHIEAVRKYRQVKKSHNNHAYELARERFNKPMSLVERDLILGKNFAKARFHAEASEAFKQALEKCKQGNKDYPLTKIPELRFHIAKTNFEKKDIQAAVSDFKEILVLKNVKEKWIKPWSHFYLGRCLEKSGESQSALAEYDAASEFDDNELRFQIDRRREELQNKPEPKRGLNSFNVK